MDEPHRQSPFVTLRSRIAWSSAWFQVRQDEILTPDGRPGTFNVVEHKGAVWIIPITDDGKIALLYHYRYSIDDWCWEIPAGGMKEGLSLEQTALEELREEIGGKARQIEYAGQFYTSNGISNEVAHIFIATGVTIGATAHEPAEVMELHLRSIDEALRMAHANEISDGPSALALLLNENRLRELSE